MFKSINLLILNSITFMVLNAETTVAIHFSIILLVLCSITLTNNIEMDSSNMQGFVDKVRTDLSSVSLTSQMYEMEVPAVDEGRADITIEDREQDIDYGNGDYGSRFNDDPDYDINRPVREEPDIEESPVMDDIEDFDLSDEF